MEGYIFFLLLFFSWENEIVGTKVGWKVFFFIIIIFLFIGRTNTKKSGASKIWGKMRDGPEGEGGKRLNTNCGDSDFVVSLEKKGFLLLFLIVFFVFVFLLFDFIAMQLCFFIETHIL